MCPNPFRVIILTAFLQLCVVGIFIAPLFAEPTIPSSLGPAHKDDAQDVLLLGQRAFGKGDYTNAAFYLQRFIDRFPGQKGYLDAHLLLGITRIRMNQNKEALDPLRKYIQASSFTHEGFRTRLTLAQALLALEKNDEALLSALEVIRPPRKIKVPAEIRMEALLVRSLALMGLKQDLQAKQALDSFDSERAGKSVSESLLSQAFRVRVELKLRECASLPGDGPLDEGEVREKIKLRGLCLLESLAVFQESLKSGNDYWNEQIQLALQKGFRDFASACNSPPKPTGKRTPKELEQYRLELVNVLIDDFDEFKNRAVTLIQTWDKKIPEIRKHHSVRLSDEIRGTRVRITQDHSG